MQQTTNTLSNTKNLADNAYHGTKNLVTSGLHQTGHMVRDVTHGTTHGLTHGSNGYNTYTTQQPLTTNQTTTTYHTTNNNMPLNSMNSNHGQTHYQTQGHNGYTQSSNVVNNMNHGPVTEHKEVIKTETDVVYKDDGHLNHSGHNTNLLGSNYKTSSPSHGTIHKHTTKTQTTVDKYAPNNNTYSQPMNTMGQTVTTVNNTYGQNHGQDHYIYKPVTTKVSDTYKTYTPTLTTGHHTTGLTTGHHTTGLTTGYTPTLTTGHHTTGLTTGHHTTGLTTGHHTTGLTTGHHTTGLTTGYTPTLTTGHHTTGLTTGHHTTGLTTGHHTDGLVHNHVHTHNDGLVHSHDHHHTDGLLHSHDHHHTDGLLHSHDHHTGHGHHTDGLLHSHDHHHTGHGHHTDGLLHTHDHHHTGHHTDGLLHTHHTHDHPYHLGHHLPESLKTKYVGMRNMVSHKPIVLSRVDMPHSITHDNYTNHHLLSSMPLHTQPVETIKTTTVEEHITRVPETHVQKQVYHVNQLPQPVHTTTRVVRRSYQDVPLKTPVKKEVDYFDVEHAKIQNPVVHVKTTDGCYTTTQQGLQSGNYGHTTNLRSSNYKTQPLHLGDSTLHRQSLQQSHDSNYYRTKKPSYSIKRTQVTTTDVYENPGHTTTHHYTTTDSNRQILNQSNHSNQWRNSTGNVSRNLYTSQAYNQPSSYSNRKVVKAQTTKRVSVDQANQLRNSGMSNSKYHTGQPVMQSSHFKQYNQQHHY